MATDNKKVWNEDLVQALMARHQQAWQQKKQKQHQWRKGAETVESIRKDIKITSTGKIYNLDPKKFNKTVYEECVRIIKGEARVLPEGFAFLSQDEHRQIEEHAMMPYIEKLAKGSGAYAILLAFHLSGRDTLSKNEIIRLAQPHCNSEMEANYHSGRMFGAWKSKDTLVSHGLITEHKAGVRYTPGGFRSNGKSTYSISSDGKRAIRQMRQKWPDIKESVQADDVFGGGDDAYTFGPVQSFVGSQVRSSAKQKSEKSGDDGQELRKWIDSAVVGQQKVFKVGKARRQFLHNLCDQLEQERPGLRLEHQSESVAGTRRELYVTLRGKPLSGVPIISPVPSSVASVPSKKRPYVTGSGQKLGGASKKPRSAVKAAASAALARFEQQAVVKSEKNHPITELLEDSDDDYRNPGARTAVKLDDSDDEDRKPAATTKQPHNLFNYRVGDECLLKSDGRRCLVMQVHRSGHLTVALPEGGDEKFNVRDIQPCPKVSPSNTSYHSNNTATPQSNSVFAEGSSENGFGCIDLCSDDDSKCTSNRKLAARQHVVTMGGASSLIIYIDDRERSRNHKPRELRIELTKELRSGSLRGVWPRNMPISTVEECKLHYGDFAFVEENNASVRSRLSITVERKRVADLVQRSTYGAHWKQLTRMRDSCQHAIMLIENDTQFAIRFDAYGS